MSAEGIRPEQPQEHVRDLVLEGMASGPGPELDEAYFRRLRAHLGGSHD